MTELSYDLVVVGAGSGNMLFGPELDGLRSAVVEPDRFGGTCLNRGCIPSKMLVVAADAARAVREPARLGVHATLDRVDWPAIRDRVFGRHRPAPRARPSSYRRGERDRRLHRPGPVRRARGCLEVGGRDSWPPTAIVVAAGSRPVVPPIPGLDSVPFHTSDTIMRVDEVPRR